MRQFSLLLLGGLLALGPVRSAEIDSEDFDRLKSRVNAQEEGIESFRTALQAIREELSKLRSENDSLRTQLQNSRAYATQDQLTNLVHQVREIEKNRAEDKTQILEAIEKLKALPPVVVPEPPPAKPNRTNNNSNNGGGPRVKPNDTAKPEAEKPSDAGPELPTEYFEHKVADGESLGEIIEAYNKQRGLKVRLAHVLKANPSIKDPKKIRVGQVIKIPMVK